MAPDGKEGEGAVCFVEIVACLFGQSRVEFMLNLYIMHETNDVVPAYRSASVNVGGSQRPVNLDTWQRE